MQLTSVLDLAAAKPLWQELCAIRRAPLMLDASGVERLGGQCLQLLLAAQRAWRSDGVAFNVINPSSAFCDAVRLMGAADLLATEGGA